MQKKKEREKAHTVGGVGHNRWWNDELVYNSNARRKGAVSRVHAKLKRLSDVFKHSSGGIDEV